MTQLSMAIMALQPDSVFAKQYSAGAALDLVMCKFLQCAGLRTPALPVAISIDHMPLLKTDQF